MKERVNISIDKDVWEQFKKYCRTKGMKASSKIELLIKKVLENER
jgi:antitoxin component of RelBE/YafQ-DinJ toxin-antitoxin module